MIDLQFAQVSKRYQIQSDETSNSSASKLLRKLRSLRRPQKEFWAIRNVSFEVERGEALGIIGHNGAGKSTILKLLSNITAPTEGEIHITGSLSALIEVGSGFHPELTGRENIYLNGSILGMRRREISRKLDTIVDFAGIKPFLDIPVKRYSSGMYVRLGFSIAAHLEPDILLLDEVLAVGDLAFQAKCLQRIDDLRKSGTTIVFISHDLGAVQRLCDRVILLKQGEIVATGKPATIVHEYQRASTDFSPPQRLGQSISKVAETTSLRFHDGTGKESFIFRTGEPLYARLEFIAHQPIEDCVFEIFFYTGDMDMPCEFSTGVSGGQIDLTPGKGAIEFSCDELGLLPGLYYIDVTIKKREATSGKNIDWQCQRAMVRVDPGTAVRGRFYMPHNWRHDRSDALAYTNTEATISEAISKV